MMLMFPEFLMDPAQLAARERQRAAYVQARCSRAVPWDENLKWSPELNLLAHTYSVRSLFDVPAASNNDPNLAPPDEVAVSPCGRWLYMDKVLPKGGQLHCVQGSKRGTVLFDGPVKIPALHEARPTGCWDQSPWMSLTPQELITLRPGTKRAKGRTIVAGLGLGHQLIEVSRRKHVTSLVLVERDRSLVDWLLPKVEPHLGRPRNDIEVVVGDAYVELPKLGPADVALLDIFPRYGNNSPGRDEVRRTCPEIKFVWAWGAAAL